MAVQAAFLPKALGSGEVEGRYRYRDVPNGKDVSPQNESGNKESDDGASEQKRSK
jgi:hypothetical protein